MWKPISGYEGLYEVSLDGQVRSIGGRKGTSGKILRQQDQRGYQKVDLCKNGKKRTFQVHRLVAQEFLYNSQNKPYINHIDGKPYNNNIINLEWCDHQENMTHAWRTGLMNNRGELHGMHKLTKTEAGYIKEHRLMTVKQLSDMFKISEGAVYDIWAGRTWRSA